MRRLSKLIRRYAVLLPVLLFLVVVVALLSYLGGGAGILRSPVTGATPLAITAVPPLPGTPVARFARVDPAIISQLEYNQPVYGLIPLDVLGANVQPIGAFLPKSGSVQFEFVAPTALPTPLPYATSPPLPLPPVPQQILPTISPLDDDGKPRTLPYAGAACAPSGLPVDGILTQRYHVYHSGIDLATPLGTAVVATHSGTVTFADWSDIGYGYLVILQNGPYITYYAHNLSFNVSVNQLVGRGSIIAWSGSTGNSTGPHVHYETRINDVPVDPLTFEDRGYGSC